MQFGHVRHDPDLITAKLPALHFYHLAITAPKPPPGSWACDALLTHRETLGTLCSECTRRVAGMLLSPAE